MAGSVRMVVGERWSVEEWARAQFGTVALGDKRRTARAVRVGTDMARHPAGSVPKQCGGAWAAAKAVYRFFSAPTVTHEAMLAPHTEQTRQAAATHARVLMIHDSTTVDYTHHRSVTGLGPIGDGGGRGFILQNALAVAVDVAGEPMASAAVLGLAHQALYLGRRVPKGETRTQRRKRQRKGQAWVAAVEATGPAPAGRRWIHVADREGDSFPFVDACRRMGSGWLVRVAQNRRAAAGHAAEVPDTYAKTLARSLPAWGGKRLWVRPQKDRPARWAHLSVTAGPVTIFPPWLGGRGQAPLRGWLVRVWEEQPPAGEPAIEWILFCSEPVEDLLAALEVAEWYGGRWLIEEYHKCLKSGCRVEERQLETAERLRPMIGMLAVVAVRLLQLKEVVRTDPDRPALACVPALHVQVLAAHQRRPVTMTVREFWRGVAQLGGFLGRRRDGDPGWQTLWSGWRELDLMTIGTSLPIQDTPS